MSLNSDHNRSTYVNSKAVELKIEFCKSEIDSVETCILRSNINKSRVAFQTQTMIT